MTELIDMINNKMVHYLSCDDSMQKIVYDAMRYSVAAGGKRLRPILMLKICEALGGDINKVIPYACAIEFIHTYSLIHDDLPAMDNDDLRRGKPTNHKVFGEAIAVLAGDALLNLAFEVASSDNLLDSKTQVKVISLLAASSGCKGMIGGQVGDIISEGKQINSDTLKNIHRLKTGAIIKSSCEIGAIIAGANDEQLLHISKFAENLGIAFQIRDDILDVLGDEKELGKPIGSDKESNKVTYVSLFGLEKSEKLCMEYSKKAKDELLFLGEKGKELLSICDKLTERKS